MGLLPELFFTLLWATSFGLTALFLVVRMLRVGLGVPPGELRGALRAGGAAAIGWVAAGPAPPARRQLARVTALRNVGLSLLIAMAAVPHRGVALVIVAFVVALLVLRAVVTAADAAPRRRVGVDHAVPSA